jgi:hypothetical protein
VGRFEQLGEFARVCAGLGGGQAGWCGPRGFAGGRGGAAGEQEGDNGAQAKEATFHGTRSRTNQGPAPSEITPGVVLHAPAALDESSNLTSVKLQATAFQLKIRNFAHKGLKWLYSDGRAKGVPPETVDKLRKMFAYLDQIEHP